MPNITNYAFLFQSMFGGTKSTWGTGATLPGVFQFSQLNSASIQSQLKAAGIDICGENGEYHTLVTDGPIFQEPLHFKVWDKLVFGDYAVADIQ